MAYSKKILYMTISSLITLTTLDDAAFDSAAEMYSATGVSRDFTESDPEADAPLQKFTPSQNTKPFETYSSEPNQRDIDYNKTYNSSKSEQPYTELSYRAPYRAEADYRHVGSSRLGVPYFEEKSR